ncbi:hypothetical protein AHAS_Ahas03G0235800 [Arachis hypogaea]
MVIFNSNGNGMLHRRRCRLAADLDSHNYRAPYSRRKIHYQLFAFVFIITSHLRSCSRLFSCSCSRLVSLLRLSSVARASLASVSARVVLPVRVVSLTPLPPRIFLFLVIFFKHRFVLGLKY